MPELAVRCSAWLGVTDRYRVVVDGAEAGRLGHRNKQVTAAVTPGQHEVFVAYQDWTTEVEQLTVGPEDSVQLELLFAPYRSILRRAFRRPPFSPSAFPRGATEIMTLRRVDQSHPA